MAPVRIALVGIGKIARDQHLPALAAEPSFELVAAVDREANADGLPGFDSLDALLRSGPAIDAVSLCTPPQVRHAIAREALANGLHVMLEKPPAATLGEALALADFARQAGRTLFASWHSRAAAGIGPAREWLSQRDIEAVTVTWKEDVCAWHPGQTWIREAGGLGVFDPGINAISILTLLLPGALLVEDAELSFPSNWDTPVAAELALRTTQGVPVSMSLDFLFPGEPAWEIRITTPDGTLRLAAGGARLAIDDRPAVLPPVSEYGALYRGYAELIAGCRIDADVEPLRIVADALLCGRRETVAACEN